MNYKKNELVIVGQNNENMLIDARLLHQQLQITTRFNDWIQRRIQEFGFEENQDFYSILSKSVFGRIIPVTVLSFILPALVYFNMEESLLRTILVIAVSCISTMFLVYSIGMTESERKKVIQMIKNKISKKYR